MRAESAFLSGVFIISQKCGLGLAVHQICLCYSKQFTPPLQDTTETQHQLHGFSPPGGACWPTQGLGRCQSRVSHAGDHCGQRRGQTVRASRGGRHSARPSLQPDTCRRKRGREGLGEALGCHAALQPSGNSGGRWSIVIDKWLGPDQLLC